MVDLITFKAAGRKRSPRSTLRTSPFPEYSVYGHLTLSEEHLADLAGLSLTAM
jgi:hypothetical protein